MAWSFAGRKSGTEHDPRIALAYTAKIEALIGLPSFVQLFNPNFSIWWNEIMLRGWIPRRTSRKPHPAKP
jgi:hypothetical protein